MVVLGSTGSIGENSLILAQRYNIDIEAISCAKNYQKLNEQIEKFHPKFVCIADENLKKFVKHDKIFCGEDGILAMLENCQSELVINALVGFSGLLPSLKTQELGKILALANKESLVVGGKFLDTSKIRPIDSEHFGLKFLLKNQHNVSRLIITASGGAFYDKDADFIASATPSQALKHPNWSMGAKITIDSATMANKLFEVIEAYHLYGVKNIEAYIEHTSSVHALVDFEDGSMSAHFSGIDMKLAIAHAIFPDLKDRILPPVNLCDLPSIKFEKINIEKYPIFSLKEKLLNNPDLGVIINAANEVGVYKFLEESCKFGDIAKIVLKATDKFKDVKIQQIADLVNTDKMVREWASKELG